MSTGGESSDGVEARPAGEPGAGRDSGRLVPESEVDDLPEAYREFYQDVMGRTLEDDDDGRSVREYMRDEEPDRAVFAAPADSEDMGVTSLELTVEPDAPPGDRVDRSTLSLRGSILLQPSPSELQFEPHETQTVRFQDRTSVPWLGETFVPLSGEEERLEPPGDSEDRLVSPWAIDDLPWDVGREVEQVLDQDVEDGRSVETWAREEDVTKLQFPVGRSRRRLLKRAGLEDGQVTLRPDANRDEQAQYEPGGVRPGPFSDVNMWPLGDSPTMAPFGVFDRGTWTSMGRPVEFEHRDGTTGTMETRSAEEKRHNVSTVSRDQPAPDVDEEKRAADGEENGALAEGAVRQFEIEHGRPPGSQTQSTAESAEEP